MLDVVDDRDSAGVAVLGPQAVEDPPDRVPLLAGRRLILLQDLVNERQKRGQLGAFPRLTLTITGRLGMAHDLFERLPVERKLPAHRPFGFLLEQNKTANFGPVMQISQPGLRSRIVRLAAFRRLKSALRILANRSGDALFDRRLHLPGQIRP